MNMMTPQFDWSEMPGDIADVFPNTDIATLWAMGNDRDAGLRHIADCQDLTLTEAAEVVSDRLLIRPVPSTYRLAAE